MIFLTMTIKERLDAIVDRYNLLNHPFYQDWNAGTLPVDALKTYAEEYGNFVKTVPIGWAAHGDYETAAEEIDHVVLWQMFAQGLGTDVAKPKLMAVQHLVDTCNKHYIDPVRSLGGLYAFEAQQPHTSQTKLKGLRDHYGQLPIDRVEPYFEIHVDDIHEMAMLIERLETKSQAEQDDAVEACEEVAKALWDSLSEIHNLHCSETVH